MTEQEPKSSSTSSSSTPSPPGIQVICAGLGRTGTYSLAEALTILGYQPYHYVHANHVNEWVALARGEEEEKDAVDTVLEAIVQQGHTAVMDNPSADIYTDILARYPSAKVILTVRDSPQKFETSWKTLFETMVITESKFRWTFPSFFGYIPLFQKLKEIRQFMGTTHLGLPQGALTHGWRDQPNGWIGEQYLRHNQHVQAHVPADQLLVFNVKHGWKPLCEFLNKEIPPGDFPHSQVNDSKALKGMRNTFLAVVYGWIPIVVTTVGFAVGYSYGWSSKPPERESVHTHTHKF